ncbi:MAG TPA: LysM peptidoglycan-binding domain-containing protein [Microbacterium sp.]|uniref:LysM peptidoglycan-binding domain-containing protein n=1 Tax=Microbacterium sp. TaxID=51671 RepID=UPI002BEC8397|nr:LysM peptidoglycan-binding domain-containing protein [Microbacterium sp.]HWI30097.1 LysM peptidoglycan-binding domain-containing protein [Microbacterium sp.]
MPAAIVGSIALSLAATPAAAVTDLSIRGTQAGAPKPVGSRPQAAAVSRPASTPVPPSYAVVAGDTVFDIARRFGLRTADVLAWNGLTSSSVIHPGQVLALAGAPAAASPPATPVAAPAAGIHTIAKGDTISAIAKKYGFTTQAVLAANGLSPASIIYPGQTIALPGAAAASPVAPPQAAAPATPPAATPAPGASSHTIAKGDTISAIAKKYGFTTQAVLAANGLTPASIIYPGQTIALPVAFVPVASTAPVAPPAPQSAVLDAEQAANARLIIGVGRQLGVSDRGIAIALATAMVESSMRNLTWGDRDSLGLFQQRPSTGWGTDAEVSDATRATLAFYGGPTDPNGPRTRGLLDIPGWQDMGFSQAAQAVQISAFPDRYGAWEAASYQWLAALG